MSQTFHEGGPANNNRCRFREKTNPFPERPTEVCAATSTRHGVKYERPFPDGPQTARTCSVESKLRLSTVARLCGGLGIYYPETLVIDCEKRTNPSIFSLGTFPRVHFLRMTRLCGREQTSTHARRRVLGRRRRCVKYFIKRPPPESNATDVTRCLHVFDYSCSILWMRPGRIF